MLDMVRFATACGLVAAARPLAGQRVGGPETSQSSAHAMMWPPASAAGCKTLLASQDRGVVTADHAGVWDFSDPNQETSGWPTRAVPDPVPPELELKLHSWGGCASADPLA